MTPFWGALHLGMARAVVCGSMRIASVGILVLALSCTQAHSAQKKKAPRHKGTANRIAQPPPLSVDIPIINAASPQPDLPQGATGSPVVRAQILLARAHFSCGEIDANFGTNLYRTVRA